MEAKRSGAGRHGLSSAGTFLAQVPVQCQEPQGMTDGNARNAGPAKAQAARHNPDLVRHWTRRRPDDAQDAALNEVRGNGFVSQAQQ